MLRFSTEDLWFARTLTEMRIDVVRTHNYPNEIGPGVYDIHSRRLPDVGEMTELMTAAWARLATASSGSIPTVA